VGHGDVALQVRDREQVADLRAVGVDQQDRETLATQISRRYLVEPAQFDDEQLGPRMLGR
jgi:hypothetical protein